MKKTAPLLALFLTPLAACTLTISPATPKATISAIEALATTPKLAAGTNTRLYAYVVGSNNPGASVNWNITKGGGLLSSKTGSSVIYTAPTTSSETSIEIEYVSDLDQSKGGSLKLLVVPNTKPTTPNNAITQAAWTRQFGTAFADQGVRLVMAENGETVMVGNTSGVLEGKLSAGKSDVFLAKTDAMGKQQWVKQFGSSENDNVADLVKIAPGRYVAVGETQGNLLGIKNKGGEDGYAVCFDDTGTVLWNINFATKANDKLRAVAVTKEGDILVLGDTQGVFEKQVKQGKPDGINNFLAKLKPTGETVWLKQFGPPTTDTPKNDPLSIQSTSLSLDSKGEIYISGVVAGLGAIRGKDLNDLMDVFDVYVARLNPEGEMQWFTRIATPQSDLLGRATIDGDDNILVYGMTLGSFGIKQGQVDAFLAKIDPTGKILWATNLGTPSIEFVVAHPVVADTKDIYLVGSTTGAMPNKFDSTKNNNQSLLEQLLRYNPFGGTSDIYIMRVSTDGEPINAWQFGTLAGDVANEAAYDPATKSLYLLGITQGSFDAPNLGDKEKDDVVVGKYPLDVLEAK